VLIRFLLFFLFVILKKYIFSFFFMLKGNVLSVDGSCLVHASTSASLISVRERGLCSYRELSNSGVVPFSGELRRGVLNGRGVNDCGYVSFFSLDDLAHSFDWLNSTYKVRDGIDFRSWSPSLSKVRMRGYERALKIIGSEIQRYREGVVPLELFEKDEVYSTLKEIEIRRRKSWEGMGDIERSLVSDAFDVLYIYGGGSVSFPSSNRPLDPVERLVSGSVSFDDLALYVPSSRKSLVEDIIGRRAPLFPFDFLKSVFDTSSRPSINRVIRQLNNRDV
jgi:hypothetical protein